MVANIKAHQEKLHNSTIEALSLCTLGGMWRSSQITSQPSEITINRKILPIINLVYNFFQSY